MAPKIGRVGISALVEEYKQNVLFINRVDN